MIRTLALLPCVAVTSAVSAGLTEFSTQVSTDGGRTWSSSAYVTTDTPGATVRVLARSMIRFIPSAGDPAFDKLNSSRHQPVVSGLTDADAHIAGFNSTGNIGGTSGGPNFLDGIQPATDLGRDFGAGTTSAILAHRTSPSSLHFAESTAANPPGTGDGVNNVNGSRGVNCAQNLLFQSSINVLEPFALFYYGLDLVAPSVFNTSRVVTMDVPAAGVGLRGTVPNQFRGVAWGYNDPSNGLLVTVNTPLTASITGIVEISFPSPGAAPLMGLAGLVAGRRRR
ncbi:MAG: hypothetical protein ACOYN0_01580 [Phycisphaerales bacterium]